MHSGTAGWKAALCGLMLVGGWTGSVVAAGPAMFFLTDTPMANFSERDRELFYAAAIDALNDAADEAPVKWSNPESTARGVITPLRTVNDSVYGLCREVRVSNEAGGVRRAGVYKACRATTGTWRLLSAGGSGTAE